MIPMFVKRSCLLAAVLAVGGAQAETGYIESDGTQALSLGRKMTPQTRWEIDFALTDTTPQQRVFGVSTGPGQLALYISGGNLFSFGASLPNPGGYTTSVTVDTARHLAIGDGPAGRGYIVTEGVTNGVSSAFEVRTDSSYPLALAAYASNTAGTAFDLFAKARFYGVKVFESDVLVMELVPAKNGSRYGFWDKIGERFYASGVAGTNFAGGGDLIDAEDGYLQTDGGQLIDTRYKASPATRYEIDYALEAINTSFTDGGTVQSRLLGAAEDASDVVATIYVAGTAGGTDANIAFSSGDAWNGVWTGKGFDATRRTVVLDLAKGQGVLYENGAAVSTKTITRPTKTATRNTGLFGQLGANGKTGYYQTRIKLYAFRIYEGGELVHDYLPFVRRGIAGLRDEVDGVTFLSPIGKGRALACGGLIASDGADDAFLASTGDQIINTSAKATRQSRIEVDFALTEHLGKQERIFGATKATDLIYGVYCNGSVDGEGNFSIAAGDYVQGSFPGYDTGVAVDLDRHTAILDFAAGKLYFLTGATTNYTRTIAAPTQDSTWLMGIFGEPYTATFNGTDNRAKVKLFALRHYEAGVLVHHWLPYRDATRLGLKDVVTGTIRTDGRAAAAPFSSGGCGWGPAHRPFYQAPESCTNAVKSSVVLSAWAPAALKYQWFAEGAVLPEETNTTLTVAWLRSRAKVAYGVQAQFEVNGQEIWRASDTAWVYMVRPGIVINMR